MAITSCMEYYESIIGMPAREKLSPLAAALLEREMTACWKGGQITEEQFTTAMTVIRLHSTTSVPAEAGPADFIFRVEAVRLTPAQKGKIATAIQGAVLTELAQLDLGGQQSGVDYLFRPITWYGGRVIGLDNLESASGTTLIAAEEKKPGPE
jgi:hypothetical protein